MVFTFFEPLWSLMTKGEKNKDISTWGEIVYKDSERGRISHRGRDMTKERDQLK